MKSFRAHGSLHSATRFVETYAGREAKSGGPKNQLRNFSMIRMLPLQCRAAALISINAAFLACEMPYISHTIYREQMLGAPRGAPLRLIEEAGGSIDHSDSQTFALSVSYTNSLQFTTLYALPHGLPRHAKSTHCLRYRYVVRRCGVHQQPA